MGANEKYEAAMHGGQYTPATENVEHSYVAYRSSKVDLITGHHEFTRWLATVRADAKAEALNEVLAVLQAEIEDAPPANHEEDNYEAGYIAGLDFLLNAKALANQYKEAPSA